MNDTTTTKVIFNKSGSGSMSTKVHIPISWIKQMDVSPDRREVELTFSENQITIVKKQQST